MNNLLETKRLLLRPFTQADYKMVYAIAADPDTTKYLYYWARMGMTAEEDTQRFLDYAVGGWAKNPVINREYVLIRKEDGAAIGDGSIQITDEKEAEIGWILLPEYRGKGYVTEMARELLRFGFEEMQREHIIASCDSRNAASYRVMERLRMHHAETKIGARAPKQPGDAPGDTLVYSITKEEWKKVCP
ncbi:MAG: GNAT family N-acetyltransferase [Clostridia bacterium]|nr:GNAT family N-acetyltransferase [Clostridia bacterium]